VLEAACLVLQALVFAGDQLRGIDLADDVPQVIGAALRFRSPRLERLDVLSHRRQRFVRNPHLCRLLRRAAERVEDRALRVGIEQGLCLVLTVQVHEQRPISARRPP
jgi:hypothetical protein